MPMNWAVCDGDVPIMRALSSIQGWRTNTWWRNRSAWGKATDPTNVTRCENTQIRIPQQRSAVGYSDVVKGMNPAPHISRTFTIHNYGYGIAYTFTHNNITLEHTVMNDKNTIAHTDAYNTQF